MLLLFWLIANNLSLSIHLNCKGGSPPLDRTIKEIVPSRVSLTLFVVLSVFSVFGIILALVFLIMNIKYRKQRFVDISHFSRHFSFKFTLMLIVKICISFTKRYIKMSSPYLNNLIIIGCTLTYTSVILLGLDSRLLSEANFPYICAVSAR